LGIIVNELITNAMKHTFAHREDGSISVTASYGFGVRRHPGRVYNHKTRTMEWRRPDRPTE
jgi:two-component sensor histidine kinase